MSLSTVSLSSERGAGHYDTSDAVAVRLSYDVAFLLFLAIQIEAHLEDLAVADEVESELRNIECCIYKAKQ